MSNIEADYGGNNIPKSGRRDSSGGRGVRPASARAPGSARASDFFVRDGTVMHPVRGLVSADNGARRKVQSPGPSRKWTHLPGRTPRAIDEYDHYNTPGAAPRRSKSAEHVYRSHAQLSTEKRLHEAHNYRHSSHWERIEAGSNHHTADGSDWESVARSEGLNRKRGSQTNRVTPTKQAPRRQESKERVSKPMRSRSADPAQRMQRQSPRAASTERASQRRDKSDTRRYQL